MMERVPGVRDRARAEAKAPAGEDRGQTFPILVGAVVVPGGVVAVEGKEREAGLGEGEGRRIRKEFAMPGGDRTGPRGEGPMTGRGLGSCGGFAATGRARGSIGWGHGYGAGGRGGRGWRHMHWETGLPRWMRSGDPTVVPGVAREWLEARARALESELAAIRTHLDKLVCLDDREQEGTTE